MSPCRRSPRRPSEPVSENGAEPAPVAEPPEEPSESESGEDWGYVPMSEWGDEFR